MQKARRSGQIGGLCIFQALENRLGLFVEVLAHFGIGTIATGSRTRTLGGDDNHGGTHGPVKQGIVGADEIEQAVRAAESGQPQRETETPEAQGIAAATRRRGACAGVRRLSALDAPGGEEDRQVPPVGAEPGEPVRAVVRRLPR